MEKMVVDNFNKTFKNKNILITGHTGFKGSWMSLWLNSLGANVTGLSLNPIKKFSHWENIKSKNINSIIGDIKNYEFVSKVVSKSKPEIIFHLAAQPLVRKSYDFPIETWETNVMGTANLLEASKKVEGLKNIIVVTSDKCYENLETNYRYKETDRLGGHDPYSASKAAVELLVASFRRSYFKCLHPYVYTVRAGNVIGGGDWSDDRLIPDLIKNIIKNEELLIRYPKSTRPWQHVLDCIYGYLKLAHVSLNSNKNIGCTFNFGPEPSSNKSVEEILEIMKKHWSSVSWKIDKKVTFHESKLLSLNSQKAKDELNWEPILNLEESIKLTIEWYKAFNENKIISHKQLLDYTEKLEEHNAIY